METAQLENVLDHTEGFTVRFDRERGRDPGLYYLRVFGDPRGRQPWGWRFGGHHVSLNNLVVDGQLVWDYEAVHAWLEDYKTFVALAATMRHFVHGSWPPRGTEWETARWTNTVGSMRNIFVLGDGRVLLALRYNKTSQMIGGE